MRKLFIFYFLSAFVAISSCKKNDTANDPSSNTTDGPGTISMSLNGQPFSAGKDTSDQVYVFINSSNGTYTTTLNIHKTTWSDKQNKLDQGLQVQLETNGLPVIGNTYPDLASKAQAVYSSAAYHFEPGNSQPTGMTMCRHDASATIRGTSVNITFTKLDTKNKLASGTFTFTAKSTLSAACPDTVKVTKGNFLDIAIRP